MDYEAGLALVTCDALTTDIRPMQPLPKLFESKEDFQRCHGNQEQAYALVGLLYLILLAALAAYRLEWYQSGGPAWLLGGMGLFVGVGWVQFSLSNGLHEALHYNFGNRKGDTTTALLLAYPIGFTMSYRRVHHLHHVYWATSRDPDRTGYSNFPRTKWALLGRVLWNLSGVAAVRQFVELQLSRGRDRGMSAKPRAELAWLAGTQVTIFAIFTLTYGSPLAYFLLWLAPLATVAKALSSTRLLCEHGSPDKPTVIRTITGARWRTLLLGAFDFNYHAEHHLYPSIPFAHLVDLYERHRAYRLRHPNYAPLEGRYEQFDGGYLALLWHWLKILPWSPQERG
jgi:fatty acid desaturase